LGKYSHIIDKLPRILGTEGPYQVKIDEVKDLIINAASLPPHEEEQLYAYIENALIRMTEAAAQIENSILRLSGGRRHASVFAKIQRTIRQVKAAHEEEVEARINLLLMAMEQLVVDQYEVEGTTSIQLDGGGTVRVQYEPHAVVKDREPYRKWCVNEGLETQMSLAWQTTNALLKQRLLEGLDPMPGVEAYSKAKVVVAKK
jgi:hypothetical protein